MEHKKSNTVLKVALGVVLTLLVGTGFYAMNLITEHKENQLQLTKEKELVIKELDAMAKQYDEAIAENEIVNNDLIEARERIQELMDSLNIAETNLKSLWRYKTKYRQLQKEMDKLLAQNDSLRMENTLLATTLDSTRVSIVENDILNEYVKDSLILNNMALKEVVEEAAVLGTTNLKGFGVIQRTSGKIIPTERAKRSDKIRVCYTIAKNTLVGSGEKELYIQVIDPNNNTIGVNKQLAFDEKVLTYSLISKFNYENENIDICEFVATREGKEKFAKGRYTVNVFNKKELISNSEFTLR